MLKSSGAMHSATENSEICGDASSSTTVAGSTFPETAEIENITVEGESNSDFVAKRNTDLIISILRD